MVLSPIFFIRKITVNPRSVRDLCGKMLQCPNIVGAPNLVASFSLHSCHLPLIRRATAALARVPRECGRGLSLSRKVPREDCGKLGVEVYLWPSPAALETTWSMGFSKPGTYDKFHLKS